MIAYTFNKKRVYEMTKLKLKMPIPDGYTLVESPDKKSVFFTNAPHVDIGNVLKPEVSSRLKTSESILGFGLANGLRLVGDPDFSGTAEEFAQAIGALYEELDGTAETVRMPDFGGFQTWASYVDVPASSPLAMDFTTVVFDYKSTGRLVLTMNVVTAASGKVPDDLENALPKYIQAFHDANFS